MSQEVLAGYLHGFAMVYLDDIIVYSADWEQHTRHLRLIFERLREHGLRCALDKCSLGRQRLTYLGHVVDHTGNSPEPEYLARLQDHRTPNTKKEVKKFLGVCGSEITFPASRRPLPRLPTS